MGSGNLELCGDQRDMSEGRAKVGGKRERERERATRNTVQRLSGGAVAAEASEPRKGAGSGSVRQEGLLDKQVKSWM